MSYVWGDPAITKSIHVGNHTFEVTINLESALRHIRKPTSSLVIWVDAICIDQSDNMEKKHQIHLMGDIYRNTQKCLVWLGDLVSLNLEESEIIAIPEIILMLSSNEHLDELLACLRRGKPGYWEAFSALKRLLNASWWRRIWTVQEIVLPPRAEVLWGNMSVSWMC